MTAGNAKNKLETIRPEQGVDNTILRVDPFLGFLAVVSQNYAKMTGRFGCEVRGRLERIENGLASKNCEWT